MTIARATRDLSGSSGPQGNAFGHTAIGKFSFQPPKAVPSAAQEEDRSDIENTDHHGGSNLHCAMSTWQWSNDHGATIIAASPVASWFETREDALLAMRV
jgi:hypothetical protein